MFTYFMSFFVCTQRVRPHCSMKMIFFHFMDIWRSMDLLFWILFLTGFLMHVSTFEDLYVHTRRIYSVALFLMFMRLLKMLFMFKSLGIMVIMTKEMVSSVMFPILLYKLPLFQYHYIGKQQSLDIKVIMTNEIVEKSCSISIYQITSAFSISLLYV